MPQVLFSKPTDHDVRELVANMRHQDADECHAAGHDDLHRVVHEGIRASVMCYTARVDGDLAAIFGLVPYAGMLGSTGVPWLLGTPLVPKHRRILARHAQPYIARMLAIYPHLLNVVHARNSVAVHWLERMGFVIRPAEPYGPHGEPFHLFEMVRNV